MLLVASGLMFKTLRSLQKIDEGVHGLAFAVGEQHGGLKGYARKRPA